MSQLAKAGVEQYLSPRDATQGGGVVRSVMESDGDADDEASAPAAMLLSVTAV